MTLLARGAGRATFFFDGAERGVAAGRGRALFFGIHFSRVVRSVIRDRVTDGAEDHTASGRMEEVPGRFFDRAIFCYHMICRSNVT